MVVDADAIVRELQEPGAPVLAAMVERFGPGILQADGTLDRQAVADIVFGDAEALKALTPSCTRRSGAEIAAGSSEQRATDDVVVLDVPLLVECRADDMAA